MRILKAENLTKHYQMGEVTVKALRGVSFELFKGEFVVLLGPSGSGKSTILNLIGGIDKPTDGAIFYHAHEHGHDKDISKANERDLTKYRRACIGFVFQFYNLIPNLTAFENITIASSLSSNPIDANELLKNIGLFDRQDHFPSQLSGGQQQRIAIARAISKNPDILLCDEPTGALDFKTGIEVLRILKDFNTQYKKTVVIITHNAGISEMADRVFYIRDGLIDKIVENKAPVSPLEVSW